VRSHKSGFCMVDSFPFEHPGQRVFTCTAAQGLQMGWSDWYESSLDCQWVDVTGFNGQDPWKLDLEVNPAGILPESNYDNNLLSIPLVCPLTCDHSIARCLFGQCICYEDIHSLDCYYVEGIDELIAQDPSTSSSPSPLTLPSTTSTSSISSVPSESPQPSPSSPSSATSQPSPTPSEVTDVITTTSELTSLTQFTSTSELTLSETSETSDYSTFLSYTSTTDEETEDSNNGETSSENEIDTEGNEVIDDPNTATSVVSCYLFVSLALVVIAAL